jgi:hypothetical protein
MGKPGRPPIIETPEDFDRLVDEYVDLRRSEGKRLTITGLCVHLGVWDRRAFYDQANRDGFSHSVKRARMLVEADYEDRLDNREIPQAGTIFALKNFGWTDKQELEHTGPGGTPLGITVSFDAHGPDEEAE